MPIDLQIKPVGQFSPLQVADWTRWGRGSAKVRRRKTTRAIFGKLIWENNGDSLGGSVGGKNENSYNKCEKLKLRKSPRF